MSQTLGNAAAHCSDDGTPIASVDKTSMTLFDFKSLAQKGATFMGQVAFYQPTRAFPPHSTSQFWVDLSHADSQS